MPSDTGGDIIFILDSSGSMAHMGKEPVDSLKDFIRQQKTDGARITLVTFNDSMTTVIDDKPLSSKFIFHYDRWKPGGMTALLDTMGNVITRKLRSSRNENVFLVILTDGEENCSKEYTTSQIKKLTEYAISTHNWQIVYLGANHDAITTGRNLGCSISKQFEYSATGLKNMMSTCSTSLGESKKTGKKMVLTA